MGDAIAVMEQGVIMQYGSPENVYNDPANIFTARFIGDPGMNILPHGPGSIGFRASRACLRAGPGFAGFSQKARVLTREHLGEIYHYTLQTPEKERLEFRTEEKLELEENLVLHVPREALFAFDGGGTRTELAAVWGG
jgi:sn-glycerol 3-phosphate transport system ATP-binding protein